MKIKLLYILMITLLLILNINASVFKVDSWHENSILRGKNYLVNNVGDIGLGITNIPESVNKRATCGNCHEGEKISDKEAPHQERTLLVPNDKSIALNLLGRKNGGKLEFLTSEYAKDFSNGPFQAAFINDGITDSRRNPEFGNQPSFWGCDMLTKWKEPFPQEFIYSFKDLKKYIIDTFVLYNGAGGDGDGFDAEVKNFSLYVNSDIILPQDIYNVTDDGGGWSYNNEKFGYLSPNNVLGDGLFPSYQESKKFKDETWIQSKNLEYTINTKNPKWVRMDFKKATTISSIFITSDDSANVHNMETDIYKLKIIVITPTGEKVVYDNSKNQVVEDEFAKGFTAYFDPLEATGVIFKFYTDRYVEWQRILIFKKPWKKVLSARAVQKFKDYSPEIFYFTPAEAQFLKISIEANYGNPKWVNIGEVEVYNSYPKNLALYENGGRILDCSRVDNYIYGPNRLLDGKLLGDDEFSITKKDYVFADEFQVVKKKLENDNDVKVILDLGKETVFGQISHFNTGDYGAKSVVIEYSLDNIIWEELGVCEKLNFTERDLPNKDTFIFSPVRAKYIKFRYLPKSWVKNKLKVSEYEVFEVTAKYSKKGGFYTKIFDLNISSIFDKLEINANGTGRIPLNTQMKITVTTDKISPFSVDRHVSSYIINPNEPAIFNLSNIHNGDRFIQYKMVFTTKDITTTPALNNISLDYQTLEEILAEAKRYEDNKTYSSAIELYEKVKSGNYDQEWILKADQGLVRVKDTINSEAQDLFAEGNKLFDKEQFEDSIEIYRQVLRKYPESRMDDVVKEKISDANIGKEFKAAESLTQKRKYWKAVEMYKAIVDNYPRSSWATKSKVAIDEYYEMEAQDMLDNAKRLLRNDQFDEAKVFYEQIKGKYSGEKWILAGAEGIESCIKGKSDKLLKDARKFFEKDDLEEAMATYLTIIKDYSKTESAQIAKEEIEKTRDKIMDNKFKLALNLKESKKYQKAIESFNIIIQESITIKWKEKAQAQIRECEGVIKDFLVQESKNLYDQGLTLYKKEQIDKAYEIFERVVREYKNTSWDEEAKKLVDTIRANRLLEEILKEIDQSNYFEAISKFEELRNIKLAKEQTEKINDKLFKNIEKVYDAGKRYARDKEYKKAYYVYNYIKVTYSNSEWSEKVLDRLKQVEDKLKE